MGLAPCGASVGSGWQHTYSGWVTGAMARAKMCPNAPCGSMLYLAEEWYFWSEQGREGRGKVLHLENVPGTTRGVG